MTEQEIIKTLREIVQNTAFTGSDWVKVRDIMEWLDQREKAAPLQEVKDAKS